MHTLAKTPMPPWPCHHRHPPACPCLPAALSNQESLKERKLGALHQALAMYQQRLGLEFQHGEEDGEQLRVVMRQLDPRDHARPFQFAVQVVGDNTYAGGHTRGGGWGGRTGWQRWTDGCQAMRPDQPTGSAHSVGRLCC